MKPRYLLIFFCLAGIFLASCSKSSNDNTTNTTTPIKKTDLQEGQVLTYSFSADGDTMVKMRDQVVDFGFKNFPVLIMLYKETLIQKPGWESLFYPLLREKLELFIIRWANQYNMPYTSLEEKAYVYRNFLDFVIKNNLDAGILVSLITGPKDLKIETVLDIISRAKMAGKSPNDYLYRMIAENVPPEKLLTELKSTEQTLSIIGIVFGVPFFITKVIKFIEENQAVANSIKNYASFLNLGDTVLSHYSSGTTFKTKDYHLSYDVGLWEAKCTYHLEGAYNSLNSAYPGQYISKCNTLSTYAHAKGPEYIVDGDVNYSPPINVGTFESPVAELNGKVTVTYGDCCCFRKTSYLNFKIDGGTGYKETNFSTGK